ncbi:hypothetical protein CEXT_261831 [Caerostris extrusa]|uniref:TIL domain-containing protein n=1 Tax=Caerostris extrusa TaxID=172846 RepID=A0AAV4VGJ4_CAEEX|nr:hypothetical protein CEXT_261831 [Caerostris extrusa]
MRTFIIFLCVALISATFVAAKDCPANKEFGSFGDCPKSCYTVKNPGPRACTLRLNHGCKCKEEVLGNCSETFPVSS